MTSLPTVAVPGALKDHGERGAGLPEPVASMLARARRRHHWSYRQAAEKVGATAGYLCHLEHGQRSPSTVMAEVLIVGLKLKPADAARLRAVALPGVGRDHPWPRPQNEDTTGASTGQSACTRLRS